MNTESWIATGDTGVHMWKILGNRRGIIFTNRLEHLIEEK